MRILHRAIVLGTPLVFVLGRLTAPSVLAAQAAPVGGSSGPTAERLDRLSRERARHWAATAPILRCAPAPLSQRPTAAAEFARPAVLPLEQAFLDAITVKRSLATRSPAGVRSP